MKDLFYIVEKDNWFRLHIKDTHYCVSGCPTLDPLLKTVKRLIKRYKTKNKILSAFSSKEDKGRVGDKMFEVYQKEYEIYSGDYDDILDEVVSKTMEEVKNNTPLKRSQKMLAKLKPSSQKISGGGKTLSTIKKVEEKDIEEKPVVLKRPRLLKRK